jgi:hypothetical protein
MTPELSRPIKLSRIRRAGLVTLVRATPEECAAVAARMGLAAIQSFECRFDLATREDGVTIVGHGRLRAEITQTCVVSAEDFTSLVEDEFDVCFVPEGAESDNPDPDLPDEIPYASDAIDVGEAAAEQLALLLDPYPRIDGAAVPMLEDDDDPSPFSILTRPAAPDRTTH